MHRRTLLTGGPLAIAAYHTPVRRWLAKPTDTPAPRAGGRQVGRADLDELWLAAEDARRWDTKCGGGNTMASSVSAVLQDRAAPLLRGTYTEKIGAELFSATAELARVAAWAAADMGQHSTAQQHFIQALRLARSAGDVQTGSYVRLSQQTALRGPSRTCISLADRRVSRPWLERFCRSSRKGEFVVALVLQAVPRRPPEPRWSCRSLAGPPPMRPVGRPPVRRRHPPIRA
ncbi:hypothetical protein AB0940_34435 [Streptomyces sp. NPDC006656]|uniref:hypothetical protein n=1 Tax=Streptomyces sp. NPDC006656 TaxID=3156899 RepID=UPI003454CFA9